MFFRTLYYRLAQGHTRTVSSFILFVTVFFLSVTTSAIAQEENSEWNLTDDTDFWAGVDSLEALVKSGGLADDWFADDSLFFGADSSQIIVDFADSSLVYTGPIGDPDYPAIHREMILLAGYEISGTNESFGSESLQALSINPSGGIDITDPIDDQLEELRFQDSDTDHLAVINLRGSQTGGVAIDKWIDLEGKAGTDRQSVIAEGSLQGRSGRWQRFSCRNQFVWDQEQDSYNNRQNMFLLRWRKPVSPRWRLGVRGDFDYSSTEGERITTSVPSTDPDGVDSTYVIDSGFLDYRKAALRFRLSSFALNSTTVLLHMKRKWVSNGNSGSYEAISTEVLREWFFNSGFLSGGIDFERRYYHQGSSALRSFWEVNSRLSWQGTGSQRSWRGYLGLIGTLYDESGEDESSPLSDDSYFGSLEEDHCQIEAEFLYHQKFGESARFEFFSDRMLEAAIGPAGELVRSKHRSSDYTAIALKTELSLRRNIKRARFWSELSCEGGYRDYYNDSSNTLVIEGFSLSLTQSDYKYLRASLMTGGALSTFLEWDGYVSLDQEWHSTADDNARFISFSLSLKYRLDLVRVH